VNRPLLLPEARPQAGLWLVGASVTLFVMCVAAFLNPSEDRLRLAEDTRPKLADPKPAAPQTVYIREPLRELRSSEPVPFARLGPTRVIGSIPAEVILRIIRQSFWRFSACYLDGLRTKPTLEGRVTARFRIDGKGVVASLNDSNLPDQGVVGCVLRVFPDLHFPDPEGGVVDVLYSIDFGSRLAFSVSR
jgi:hypothetical protein